MILSRQSPCGTGPRFLDSPDLIALRYLFDLLPDQELLAALRGWRGYGRNPALRRVVGIEDGQGVPGSWRS